MTDAKAQALELLMRTLKRFVRAEDVVLSDAARVYVVMERFEADQKSPLIDPNE